MSESIITSVGEQLIEARNMHSLSCVQVAEQLNLPMSVITAIEEDRYELLHGEAFVCGVIRSYASLLDIDAELLVANYKTRKKLDIEISKSVDEAIIDAHSSWRHFFAANMAIQHLKFRTAYGIAAVITIAIIIRLFIVNDHVIEENPVETSITIDTAIGTTIVSSLGAMPVNNPTRDFVPEVIPVLSAIPSDNMSSVDGFEKTVNGNNEKKISSLSFTFVADCWVEVLDGNNQTIFASMQTANKKLVLTGTPPFRITLGYAPGVALSYNSQVVPINADNTNVAKLVLGNS